MSDSVQPRTVRVVERAIDILGGFQGPQDSLSLQQIVERSGLQKATAFRIATTLAHTGILAQAAPGAPYTLGYLTLRMPGLVRATNDIRARAWASLKETGALLNETVVLAIRAGDDIVNIDKVDSLHLIDETPVIGVRVPLHLAGAGLAILAHLDQEACAGYWQRTSLPPDGTLTLLAEAKARGVLASTPDGERRFAQIAAPLITPQSAIVGALSVTIPESRLSPKLLARCELHLKASADAIGSRL